MYYGHLTSDYPASLTCRDQMRSVEYIKSSKFAPSIAWRGSEAYNSVGQQCSECTGDHALLKDGLGNL